MAIHRVDRANPSSALVAAPGAVQVRGRRRAAGGAGRRLTVGGVSPPTVVGRAPAQPPPRAGADPAPGMQTTDHDEAHRLRLRRPGGILGARPGARRPLVQPGSAAAARSVPDQRRAHGARRRDHRLARRGAGVRGAGARAGAPPRTPGGKPERRRFLVARIAPAPRWPAPTCGRHVRTAPADAVRHHRPAVRAPRRIGAHFAGQHLPRDARAQDDDDPRERGAVRHPRPPFGFGGPGGSCGSRSTEGHPRRWERPCPSHRGRCGGFEAATGPTRPLSRPPPRPSWPAPPGAERPRPRRRRATATRGASPSAAAWAGSGVEAQLASPGGGRRRAMEARHR